MVRGSRNSNPVSPRGNGSVVINSVFAATIQSVTAENSEYLLKFSRQHIFHLQAPLSDCQLRRCPGPSLDISYCPLAMTPLSLIIFRRKLLCDQIQCSILSPHLTRPSAAFMKFTTLLRIVIWLLESTFLVFFVHYWLFNSCSFVLFCFAFSDSSWPLSIRTPGLHPQTTSLISH